MTTISRFAILTTMLAAAMAASLARADVVKRFGGVTITCGADHDCAATVKARGEASVFTLTRAPGWRARWIVSLTTTAVLVDRDRAIALSVDNGVDITLQPGADYDAFVHPYSYYILSQPALDRLMLQIQRGHMLRFTYIDVAGAPHADSFRLDGLPQALAEIDNQQGHIAGDRRGGPPGDLPPAPAIDAGAAIAAAGVPPRLMELHAAVGDCEAMDGPALADVAPQVGALSDSATLYALPCLRAAAGVGSRLYMLERGEIGGMHRLIFALRSNRLGWSGADILYAVRYDEGGRMLEATLLDEAGCRLAGRWSWQDTGFRLDALVRSGDCATGGKAGERLYPPG